MRKFTAKFLNSKPVGAMVLFLFKPVALIHYLVGSLFYMAGEVPSEYNVGYPRYLRVALWNLRNLGHEFRARVIGIEGSEFSVVWSGLYPLDDYNPAGGIHKHTLVRSGKPKLRFISYQYTFKGGIVFQAHAGWLKSGRFGLKARFYRHAEEK